MESVITLSRDAVEQAIKQYIERQGYQFVRFVPPDAEPMKRLSDPGSVGVVVRPEPVRLKSPYE